MAISVQDIHKTLHTLRNEGRRARDLEALLICRDDLLSLLESLNSGPFHHTFGSEVDHKTGDIEVLGVKVITSEYVPHGSIFKIFKDDTKMMAYPPEFNPIVPGSGVIDYSKYAQLLKPLQDNKKVVYKIPDDSEPLVIDDEKKVEKRHSETRKIELD